MKLHIGKKTRDLSSHLDDKIIHYQNIIEQSPFAIELLNPAGSIFFINDAWMHLWGIDEEEAAQTLQHYNMLTDKEAEARGVMPLIIKAFAGERVVLPIIEYNARSVAGNIGLDQLDAKTVWIQCHLSPVFNEDGEIQFVVNAYVDLTEETKAQKERDRVFESSPDLICISDIEGCLKYTNPAWKLIMGYSEQELLGRSIRNFTHPDDQEMVRQKKEELLEGEASFEVEIRCIAKDGTVRHVAWRCISVAAEKLSYCIGRDVTECRKMELVVREQRDALARVERTSSMGQLTGSIAHELNQPLTGILSNAQATEMMVKGGSWERDELLQTMADIVGDAKRAGEVIRSLREIYREQKGPFLSVDLNEVVSETLKLLHSEFIMSDISVTTQCESSSLIVKGNRIQLQQVLINLIINGDEAMKDLGRNARRLQIVTASDADRIKVWVDDNGPGIDADKIDHIFEPLATWKPSGTGMGLAVDDSIIRAHGGDMWAENRPEGGARVGFSLPVLGMSPA